MSPHRTQQQSDEQLQRTRDLSLQRSRPPAEVPGYDAQSWLGSGAFGEVWIGVDRNTGRRVAIKFYMHRSGLDWTLLAREVEKLVFLSADRYVVQLLDVGWSSDPPYYVMEYIENGSLADWLQEHQRMPVAAAVDMFRELSVGLIHAHGKGVLHCDLKPANILLDQDHRPRLADFGQSRLSHEQSPALGTLFYMAPEQADLEAVPDARWDVYALGALFYCLLTGAPPHQDGAAEQLLDTAAGLRERLERYRKLIQSSPPPTAHRRVAGVDRPLADIVDRCLTADPQRRFPNVQSVLDALDARDAARMRWPLVMLGFVGPVLLLLIMAVFGLRGYDRAVREAEALIGVEASQKNRMTARFAASSIEGEIYRYFVLIEKEAQRSEFRRLFREVADSPLVARLDDPANTAEDIAALRPEFTVDPTRLALQDYLQHRLDGYLDKLARDEIELKLASFLVVDQTGRMLAVAYDHNEPSRSVGWNYAYRTYFHGGPADIPLGNDGLAPYRRTPDDIEPIRETHFSAAFPSTTTGLWKVAISTPIFANGDEQDEVIGVLALTVNLGDFAYFRRQDSPDRFAVLIDDREGPQHGIVLQHPLFDEMGRDGRGPEKDFATTEFRVKDEQLARLDQHPRYRDPLGDAEGGEAYRDEWIAAFAPVTLPGTDASRSDMIVLVQERLQDAIAPVKQLGSRLMREGLWAFGGVLIVVVALWTIVLRMLKEPRMRRHGKRTGRSDPTPRNYVTTLFARRRSK